MPANRNRLRSPDLVVRIADAAGLLLEVGPGEAVLVGILDTGGVEEVGVVEGYMGRGRIGDAEALPFHDRVVPPVLVKVVSVVTGFAINIRLNVDELVVAPQIERHRLPAAYDVGQCAGRCQGRNLGVKLADLLYTDHNVRILFMERFECCRNARGWIMAAVANRNGLSHYSFAHRAVVCRGCNGRASRQYSRAGECSTYFEKRSSGQGLSLRHCWNSPL